MLERLLVVGLGSIGRRHARLARTLMPDVEIVVLRHRNCSDLDDPGIDRCVTSVDEALSLRPQAAVIANPASHHLEVAIRLAGSGVHLMVEKPISSSSRGVAALIETCRERGSVLMTGYNLRFLPSLLRFRELLEDRSAGLPLSVRAEVGQYLPGWRPGSDYRETVSAKAALGGGVLLELSHDIDYLRWLFGEMGWVSAIVGRQGALEIDVEDSAHLVIGFVPRPEGGPLVATLNMDFLRHDTTRSCTVIGDAASLRWNANTGVVDIFEAGGSSWRTLYDSSPRGEDSYLAEWHHFLECILDGKKPRVSGDDGLAVLRVIEAARRSSANGAVARIEDAERVSDSSQGLA